MLLEQLRRRCLDEQLTGSSADVLQTLIVRLAPYCEGGPLAHIADHETTVERDAPLTLFDISGLPDRLVPALIFAIVGHIEGAVQHSRTLKVSGRLEDRGAWAGRHFLVAEEGWKITASAAAGSWLNEYARRARHYKLWLIFVSQHLEDLNNEQGRALLEDSQLALFVQNTERDLAIGRETIGLTDVDVEQITTLTTRKGLYSTVYVVSPRGRGAVRILLGDLEYWICSSDPENDQPKRVAALADADGDPWEALRLLCTPEWHDRYHRAGGRVDGRPDRNAARRARGRPQVVGDPGGRKRTKLPWLILAAAGMFVMLPALLLGGISGLCSGGGARRRSANPPGGPAPGGMFAKPLKLQQGQWYEVGATEYGGPADPTSTDTGAIGHPGAGVPARAPRHVRRALGARQQPRQRRHVHVRRRQRAQQPALSDGADRRQQRHQAGPLQARRRLRPGPRPVHLKRPALPPRRVVGVRRAARRLKERGQDRARAAARRPPARSAKHRSPTPTSDRPEPGVRRPRRQRRRCS